MRASLLLSGLLAAAMFAGPAGAEGAARSPGAAPYTPTRLEWLVLTAQANYRTDMSAETGYALDISAAGPDTIKIYVRYGKGAVLEELKAIVKLVRENIKQQAAKQGWDKWLKIEEDLAASDPQPPVH
jgi:hypothetical protein